MASITIKRVYDVHNYLLDPHTAVAWSVADRLHDDKPVLVVSTAHWAKFGSDVYRALHGIGAGEDLPDAVSDMTGPALDKLIASETGVDNIPANLACLDEMPTNFDQDCPAHLAGIEKTVEIWLQNRDNDDTIV